MKGALRVVAQLACFAGILLLLWSFHWITAVAFLSAALLAYVTALLIGRRPAAEDGKGSR